MLQLQRETQGETEGYGIVPLPPEKWGLTDLLQTFLRTAVLPCASSYNCCGRWVPQHSYFEKSVDMSNTIV